MIVEYIKVAAALFLGHENMSKELERKIVTKLRGLHTLVVDGRWTEVQEELRETLELIARLRG